MSECQTIKHIAEIAKDVFSTLVSGHSEAAYQKAMEVGLRLRNVKFESVRRQDI
jgi:hypothetical protein